jgi:Protein of unknown function (DUF2510)
MSTVVADAAWYPDPGDSAYVRWWDGHNWTPHTRPTAGGPSAVGGVSAVGSPTGGWDPGSGFGKGGQTGYGQPLGGPNLPSAGSKGRNHYSLITFGVGALYLVVAFVTHFVLIGFIPLAMAMRAKRSGEPLAPLAIGAAVGVILISLLTLFH